MPSLTWSTALTANQLGYNPLSGWQYEYVPQQWPAGAVVKLLTGGTDVNQRITVYAGSQTIQERSPIQSGATAGVMPSELNTSPVMFMAAPGDRLKLAIDEVAGGTPTTVGVIVIEPV